MPPPHALLPPVRLTRVARERGKQGRIYAAWCPGRTDVCFLGQSATKLCAVVNARRPGEPRLHASSLYRILRRETLAEASAGLQLRLFLPHDLDALNAHLARFDSVCWVSDELHRWECEVEADGEPPARGRGAPGPGGEAPGDGGQAPGGAACSPARRTLPHGHEPGVLSSALPRLHHV